VQSPPQVPQIVEDDFQARARVVADIDQLFEEAKIRRELLKSAEDDETQNVGNPTGLAAFDKVSRGFGMGSRLGELIFIAAPEHQGKTTISLNFVYATLRMGFPVAYVSLEEDAVDILANIIAIDDSYCASYLSNSADAFDEYARPEKLNLSNLYLTDRIRCTKGIADMEVLCRACEEQTKRPPQYLIFDNLTAARAWFSKGNDFMENEDSAVSSFLEFGARHNVPIVCLMHVTKGGATAKTMSSEHTTGSYQLLARADQVYLQRAHFETSGSTRNLTIAMYCHKRRGFPSRGSHVFLRGVNGRHLEPISRSSIQPKVLMKLGIELTDEEQKLAKGF